LLRRAGGQKRDDVLPRHDAHRPAPFGYEERRAFDRQQFVRAIDFGGGLERWKWPSHHFADGFMQQVGLRENRLHDGDVVDASHDFLAADHGELRDLVAAQ